MAGNVRGCVCSQCFNKVSRYDETIDCLNCKGCFHIRCVNIDESAFREMRVDKSVGKWKCTPCEQGLPVSGAVITDNVDAGQSAPVCEGDTFPDHPVVCGRDLRQEKVETPEDVGGEYVGFAPGDRHINPRVVIDASGMTRDETEIAYLKSLLHQKDMMINNMQLTIDLLCNQVSLINNLNNKHLLTSDSNTFNYRNLSSQKSFAEITKTIVSDKVADTCTSANDLKSVISALGCQRSKSQVDGVPVRNPHKFSSKEVTEALSSVQIAQATTELNNSNPKLIRGANPKKGRSSNVPIVGNLNSSDVKIRAVPRTTSLHVYRLHPETSVDDVLSHLESKFPGVLCEKLNSKFPELYSSFKITVRSDLAEEIMSPSTWPDGTCVNKFFLQRPKKPAPA